MSLIPFLHSRSAQCGPNVGSDQRLAPYRLTSRVPGGPAGPHLNSVTHARATYPWLRARNPRREPPIPQQKFIKPPHVFQLCIAGKSAVVPTAGQITCTGRPGQTSVGKKSPMPEAATGRFNEVRRYEASLPGRTTSLVVTRPGPFEAQLTWIKLPNVHLLRAYEALARVAYVSLPKAWVIISFATQPGSSLFYYGVEVPYGQIVFHAPGESLHQRTTGSSQWGLIAVRCSFFVRYTSALAGYCLEPPTVGQIVRVPAKDLAHLLQLHARAARLVETKPFAIRHPEVSRAHQHELLHAVASCLIGGSARALSQTEIDHAEVIIRFEAALADWPNQSLSASSISKLIGVSERKLRICCNDLLGVAPGAYMHLRRLNLARAAIVRAAHCAGVQIGDVAREFGFRGMSRFTACYSAAFGETPSMTLRRVRELRS